MALTIMEIAEIKHMLDYAHHISDARNLDALHEIFTEDAVYDLSYRGLPPVQGFEAIREMKAVTGTRDRSDVVSHHLTNTFVRIEEDGQIHARSKTIVVLKNGNVRSNEYDDVVVRTDKGWRIKSRRPDLPVSVRNSKS